MNRAPLLLAVPILLLFLTGCATLQSIAALSQVRFELDRVGRAELAGVDVTTVRSYEDLSVADGVRIGSALVGGTLPLELAIDVSADNPEGNPDARLLRLDWRLFLEDRETVSGELQEVVQLPSGRATSVRVPARLDLLQFFEDSARDLVNLIASAVGSGGEPVAIRLEVVPTVDTPVGPIRYPRPLVLGGAVGSGAP